jgi:hypothetical protein
LLQKLLRDATDLESARKNAQEFEDQEKDIDELSEQLHQEERKMRDAKKTLDSVSLCVTLRLLESLGHYGT